jgi:streptomycin 6-kinase
LTVDDHLRGWHLVQDGEVIVTPSSRLVPVRCDGQPVMVKMPEERFGAGLMLWWDGDGAARVLAHEGDALLMERAVGGKSLAAMAREGRDDAASRILCAVAARLHAPRPHPPLERVPLARWFAPLEPAAVIHGDLLAAAAAVARTLLAEPREVVPLHGDLHHNNVLDFGARGWLAIDPKRLVGERGFDFANILRNPNAEVATRPGRLARQAAVIAAAAGVERERLLRWVLAFAGLSAAWLIADGETAELDLAVAGLALAELAGG